MSTEGGKNGATPIRKKNNTQHKSDKVRYPAAQGFSGTGKTHRLGGVLPGAGHTKHTKPRENVEKDTVIPLPTSGWGIKTVHPDQPDPGYLMLLEPDSGFYVAKTKKEATAHMETIQFGDGYVAEVVNFSKV